ncbi:MAG: hypothetical protein DMF02_09425, partial [Verrucomicrobia bacterium]
MRFCSPDCADGEFEASCPLARSAGPTGFARRTSGSPAAVEAAATAVGAAETLGAMEGADATLFGAVAAGPGGAA